MLWKNRVMTSLVAAGAIGVAAFGGVALATNGGSDDATATVAVARSEQADAAPAARSALQFSSQEGPQTVQIAEDGQRSCGPRGGGEVAEFLGIEPADLQGQLQAGATPAEVAEAAGSSGEALIAYLVGEAQTRLDESVANGDLTQAEADERLARHTERVARFVNEGAQERERPGRRHGGARRAVGVAAEVIGVEPQTVVEGIRAGQTVAEIAAANGSSGEAVVDALVANAQEHVDQAIADGRITAEEGAEKLAQASDHAQTFVFETPQPGERPGRPPGCPGAAGDF